MESINATILSLTSSGLVGLATALVIWRIWPRKFIAEAYERSDEAQSKAEAARRVLFDRMAPFAAPLMSDKRETYFNQRLLMMGAPDLRPVDIISMQIIWASVFTVVVGLMLYSQGEAIISGLLGTVTGVLLPLLWVRSQIQRRHLLIGRAMPFNLDLLTLSVEAGQDFGGAVQTVVKRGVPGPLTEELGIMLREMRMGKTREQALRNMADRCRFPPLSQFVSNLIQADKMGTGMGKILRIQSTQLRIQRTQRAEKLAGEAPVKMLFPLIFCIFPTVFMILFGPIVYQFIDGGP